jgi:hypothetical protein
MTADIQPYRDKLQQNRRAKVSDIVSDLIEIQEWLTKNDPLLNKGVQKDWVCVVHPRLVQPILDTYSEVSPFPPYDRLSYALGRRVYVFDTAPDDRIEYMSEFTLRAKYPKEMAENDRLRQEWMNDDNDR